MNLKHLIFIHFSNIFKSSHMSFHLKIILFIRVTEIRDIHVSFVDYRFLVYGHHHCGILKPRVFIFTMDITYRGERDADLTPWS